MSSDCFPRGRGGAVRNITLSRACPELVEGLCNMEGGFKITMMNRCRASASRRHYQHRRSSIFNPTASSGHGVELQSDRIEDFHYCGELGISLSGQGLGKGLHS